MCSSLYISITLNLYIRYQYRRTRQIPIPQIFQRRVGLAQGIEFGGYFDWHAGRQGQKLFGILAGEIGDRDQTFFPPQNVIGKRWDITHVDTSTDDNSTRANCAQRGGHQGPHGREDYCRVELFRWRNIRIASPCSAHSDRKLLGGFITAPGKREQLFSLMTQDLRHDMCCGAKTINADA